MERILSGFTIIVFITYPNLVLLFSIYFFQYYWNQITCRVCVYIKLVDWTAWAIVVINYPPNIAICRKVHVHNRNDNHDVHEVVRIEPEIQLSRIPLFWNPDHANDASTNRDDILENIQNFYSFRYFKQDLNGMMQYLQKHMHQNWRFPSTPAWQPESDSQDSGYKHRSKAHSSGNWCPSSKSLL